MQQIGATTGGSYRVEQGEPACASASSTPASTAPPRHRAELQRQLSRNFTVDIPVDANGDPIDGPVRGRPSCEDPANVDENGHGTHVASMIGSPINGLGIAGVAPKVTLVNLRAGQDSGYFFLQPSVDALTYAGDIGIDVVNMSYYVDPWLFNCANNPADSPENQAEQRTIIEATQRALDYAHRKASRWSPRPATGPSTTPSSSSDASSPTSPTCPARRPTPRHRPRDCISMPPRATHVISVSTTGITTRKAYYSDYGNGYIDVAAPGGDVYDTPDNTRDIARPSWPPTRSRSRRSGGSTGPVTRPCLRGADCNAAAPARTTSTSRAPRWRRPTPPAWRR